MTALKRWICGAFHQKIAYAGGANYSCKTCGQSFPAPWAPIPHRGDGALEIKGSLGRLTGATSAPTFER